MTYARSWRQFRRMQHTLVAVAALTYAIVTLEAWRTPGVGEALKLARTTIFPAVALVMSLAAILLTPGLSRLLIRHLWTSYRTGFGQNVISVLVGVGVLLGLAGVALWQLQGAAHGGRFPAGAFSGYAAGIGLLIAQAVLVRRIEADPELGRLIEEPPQG
jgi:hypothetical protein